MTISQMSNIQTTIAKLYFSKKIDISQYYNLTMLLYKHYYPSLN